VAQFFDSQYRVSLLNGLGPHYRLPARDRSDLLAGVVHILMNTGMTEF